MKYDASKWAAALSDEALAKELITLREKCQSAVSQLMTATWLKRLV